MQMNNENARNYAYIFTCHEECLPYFSIHTCLNYICPSICLFDSRVWLKATQFLNYFLYYVLGQDMIYQHYYSFDLWLFFKLQCNHLSYIV